MSWLVIPLVALGAAPVSSVASSPVEGTARQAESANFVVRSFHPAQDARQVAQHCERWRAKLQQYWCGEQAGSWTPKCEVAVHSGLPSYVAAAGSGVAQSYGSSLIRFGAEKKVARRLIDFRGDSPLGLAAVPHEMTHVILADLLDGRQPPRWADEGMAILADTQEKHRLHERDLVTGLASGAAFRIAELVTLESYPPPSRVAAFYGQSASVTALLAKRDDPAKFVEFLRRAQHQGYDQSLREVYHLRGIAQLEELWRAERLAWKSGYHGVRLALDSDAAMVTAAD